MGLYDTQALPQRKQCPLVTEPSSDDPNSVRLNDAIWEDNNDNCDITAVERLFSIQKDRSAVDDYFPYDDD